MSFGKLQMFDEDTVIYCDRCKANFTVRVKPFLCPKCNNKW